jgi:hypothetical protein
MILLYLRNPQTRISITVIRVNLTAISLQPFRTLAIVAVTTADTRGIVLTLRYLFTTVLLGTSRSDPAQVTVASEVVVFRVVLALSMFRVAGIFVAVAFLVLTFISCCELFHLSTD